MAHRPASTPSRTPRRTVAQKAPRARTEPMLDVGEDGDLDGIDEQFETADALRVAGVTAAAREDARRFFD